MVLTRGPARLSKESLQNGTKQRDRRSLVEVAVADALTAASGLTGKPGLHLI